MKTFILAARITSATLYSVLGCSALAVGSWGLSPVVIFIGASALLSAFLCARC